MYQNYIFDLYGTLIDIHTDESSKNFYKKYVKWLRKQGYYFEWKQFWRAYQKTEKRLRSKETPHKYPEIQVEEVFREIFLQKGYILSDEETAYLCENYRKISWISLSLFPDTIATLKALKQAGKKIYLLSNAQRSFTWQELEQTGLVPYFDGILISSDEGCRKPDSDFFEILCTRYHIKKEESVMIGNELESDVAGARAAGIDAFYINRHPVFHENQSDGYQYVSKDGSLQQVLAQTGSQGAQTC